MAKYFLHVKVFSRGKGSRVTRAAAYRAGERIRDERTSEVYNYGLQIELGHHSTPLTTSQLKHLVERCRTDLCCFEAVCVPIVCQEKLLCGPTRSLHYACTATSSPSDRSALLVRLLRGGKPVQPWTTSCSSTRSTDPVSLPQSQYGAEWTLTLIRDLNSSKGSDLRSS
jgi:hypothetical protein